MQLHSRIVCLNAACRLVLTRNVTLQTAVECGLRLSAASNPASPSGIIPPTFFSDYPLPLSPRKANTARPSPALLTRRDADMRYLPPRARDPLPSHDPRARRPTPKSSGNNILIRFRLVPSPPRVPPPPRHRPPPTTTCSASPPCYALRCLPTLLRHSAFPPPPPQEPLHHCRAASS